MLGAITAVPLFAPTVALFAFIGVAVRRRLARRLDISPGHAAALVVSLGLIVGLTLTPQREAFALGTRGSGVCDLSRLGAATLQGYLDLGSAGGNVLLFVPLGVALGLLPATRARPLLVICAILLPPVIELTQLVLTVLDRGCQTADAVDNLTGLAIGIVVGAITRGVGRAS